MATAGGPLGDTLHAPVYADLGPQVLVVLFKMSALSIRGGCPLVPFPSYIYSPGSCKLVFHLEHTHVLPFWSELGATHEDDGTGDVM